MYKIKLNGSNSWIFELKKIAHILIVLFKTLKKEFLQK